MKGEPVGCPVPGYFPVPQALGSTPLPPVHLWHWLAFGALVPVLLGLDLGLFHRPRPASWRESALATVAWVRRSRPPSTLSSGGGVGSDAGVQFLTGYLVEWSLSMDNVFVFAVIFRFFEVPLKYQYRVLFWGILGAIVMRLAFVLRGRGADPPLRLDPAASSGVFLVYTGLQARPAGRRPDRSRAEPGLAAGPALAAGGRGRPRAFWPAVLRPRRRPLAHYAAVPGVAGDRVHRRRVRRRQRAGDLRHHHAIRSSSSPRTSSPSWVCGRSTSCWPA